MAEVINLDALQRAKGQANIPAPSAEELEALWEAYWDGLENDADNDNP